MRLHAFVLLSILASRIETHKSEEGHISIAPSPVGLECVNFED